MLTENKWNVSQNQRILVAVQISKKIWYIDITQHYKK